MAEKKRIKKSDAAKPRPFLKRKTSLLHILVLGAIFTLSLVGFWKFQGAELLQLYVVSIGVLIYIAWGVVYHFYHERLSWGLFLEYVLVGALVLLLFFWMIFFA
ncbi:hypothetical protein GTO10_00960 [Candidatus Saccharibacteria bacterium]|nr:hypothetical protein [Candidatus Saccharibacteria bacterium]